MFAVGLPAKSPFLRWTTYVISVPLAGLLLSAPLFGQSATPATQPQTFHVRGTVTDPIGAVIRGVKVTFQSERTSKTVATNDLGKYGADLPLGVYTMTAQSVGFRFYRRPPFRVPSPANITFDVTLPVGKLVNRVVADSSGGPTTPGDWKTALKTPPYDGEESFRHPRKMAHRFNSTSADDAYKYTGENTPYEDPVFVTKAPERPTYDMA